jgi:hypothetical protein
MWFWLGEQVRSEKNWEQVRSVANEAELRAEETSWAKNQKMKRERRRTSQVALSGGRYFRVSVIVGYLSNKELRLIQNPKLFVTEPRIHDIILG